MRSAAAGRLVVPDDPVVPFIEVYAGEEAFHQLGSWLPDGTVEAYRKCLVL